MGQSYRKAFKPKIINSNYSIYFFGGLKIATFKVKGKTVSRSEFNKAIGVNSDKALSDEGKKRKSSGKKVKPVAVQVSDRKVNTGTPTSPERAAELRQKEVEQVKNEFARANIRGDIELNKAGQFVAKTREGERVLSVAQDIDRRTVQLAQDKAQSERQSQVVNEFNIRDTEQFKNAQKVDRLFNDRLVNARPPPPLDSKQEKLRQSINRAAEREREFNERVENTQQTFANILDMNTDDLVNFKGEKLFKDKKASETLGGEIFTTFATGLNPFIFGGALAQAGEKTKLTIQALMAGQQEEVLQETVFDAPKQVLPVFDVRTRQGQVTIATAAIGAFIPAAVRARQSKVVLEGTLAETSRVANNQGGFFEVTKIETTAKVGGKTVKVEGGSVIRGQKSPIVDDVTAFFGEQAVRTSKGTEAGSKVIGITENKPTGLSESVIGTKTKTSTGKSTETATAARTQTITDSQGLQTSRSIITDFEVFGDTFKPSRVGVSGSQEFIRFSSNDLTFSQIKSAEAAASGKGGINTFKDFLVVEKPSKGVLSDTPSGTTKTIISGDTPSVAKLNLESTIKQVVQADVKPSSFKPSPIVIQDSIQKVGVSVTPGTPKSEVSKVTTASPVTIQSIEQDISQGQDKIVKRDVAQSQSNIQDLVQEQKPVQDTRLITDLTQSQTPREAIKQIQEPISLTEPVSVITPLASFQTIPPLRVPKGGGLFLPKFNLGVNEPSSFQVFVREKGVFKPIKGNLTKDEAISLGVSITQSQSPASFKVLRQGEPVRVSVFDSLLKGQFMSSKKDSNVLVEKNKFRIDSKGELEEITFKGLKALKFKSGLF